MFAHLIKGIVKKSNIIYFPTYFFILLCAFFHFPAFVVVIFPCVFFPFRLSSLQLHIFGFNQTCPGASPGSHGGFDLFHRSAELWLGSPTLSSVCSSCFCPSSTASHFSSGIAISYTLCLISTVIYCS